jgi:hypothetical protein
MRFRFSLRTMLALTTFAAIFCLWRDAPRRNANRFVQSLASAEFETADAMFISPEMAGIAIFMKEDDRNRIEARRLPQSPRDWLLGRCYVEVKAEDFDGVGASLAGRATVQSGGIGEISIESNTVPVNISPELQMVR